MVLLAWGKHRWSKNHYNCRNTAGWLIYDSMILCVEAGWLSASGSCYHGVVCILASSMKYSRPVRLILTRRVDTLHFWLITLAKASQKAVPDSCPLGMCSIKCHLIEPQSHLAWGLGYREGDNFRSQFVMLCPNTQNPCLSNLKNMFSLPQ